MLEIWTALSIKVTVGFPLELTDTNRPSSGMLRTHTCRRRSVPSGSLMMMRQAVMQLFMYRGFDVRYSRKP